MASRRQNQAKPKQKKKPKLPNKIVVLPNEDKDGWHESYARDHPNCTYLCFTHPFRMLLSGGVNSGKTNVIKNILIHQEIPFKRILLYHCDGNFTKEYNAVETENLTAIPQPDSDIFNGKEKTLMILEDIDFKRLNKQQQGCLNRLYGFVSTHKNVSIITTAQNFFDTNPGLRRLTDVFCLWGNEKDMSYINEFSKKVGERPQVVRSILRSFEDPHDFLMIDTTHRPKTKNGYSAKLRKNGFIVIVPSRKSRVNESELPKDNSLLFMQNNEENEDNDEKSDH